MKHNVFISVNREESNNWACSNDGFDICHVETSGKMKRNEQWMLSLT